MDYEVIDSFADVENISYKSQVLLFTYRAEKGEGERNALHEFESEVLPYISSLVKERGVKVFWSNVGGIVRYSDLANYLKKKNLRACGCFLIENGEIVELKKLGRFVALPEEYINAAKEILGSLGSTSKG